MPEGESHSLDMGLPAERNLDQFAIPYSPEYFNSEERFYLLPFFSNLDRPVFVVQNLPEEVIGALSSRYSRSTLSLRRMFLEEYVFPIVRPEFNHSEASPTGDSRERDRIRNAFLEFVTFTSRSGGVDHIVNVQRGRRFFDRWLSQFGDDSIAEMGGIHLCIEGLSNIASNEIEDKRIGLSPLEKSSRYVSFLDRQANGRFRYVVPGELRGTPLVDDYCSAMDRLFDTFASISEPYLAHIESIYPQGSDETPRSFANARSAKRFDDLRDLLPFATQTNVALFGNGRAFEDLVSRILDHPIGELRWLGKAIYQELDRVVPSFIRRVQTQRGAERQIYRSNLGKLRARLAEEILDRTTAANPVKWARLISHTPDAEVAVLSAFIFGGDDGASLSEVRRQVSAMPPEERAWYLERIFSERNLGVPDAPREEVRFRKVPRAFENATFLFELWARGGDYRDLHRHRMLTQERQRLSLRWGYDLEGDVLESRFARQIETALSTAKDVASKIAAFSPDVSQYAIPFAYIQHWYMQMTAREIYWMVELRTGQQGRPHYRSVCQQMAQQAMEKCPALFRGLRADWNTYTLARRESEKRSERKLSNLGNPGEKSSGQ